MSSFWSDACNFARNRDLQTQLLVLNVFCGSAVSRIPQDSTHPKLFDLLMNHA